MLRIPISMLVLTATALATGGCGGKSSTRTASAASAPLPAQPVAPPKTGPLTRTELLAKADAYCGQVAAKRNLLKFGLGGASLSLTLPQLAAYQQALFVDLRSLTPPTSMAKDWGRIVADTRVLADSTAKLSQYARSNNSRMANAAHVQFATFAKARLRLQATARRDGFRACATY